MSNSLQRLELENTIRLLFFKHRGDLSAIIKELRDKYGDTVPNSDERITVIYVKKIIGKLKKQQRMNSPQIAVNIMDYVFMGTKQREQLWDTNNQELEDHKFYYLSGCCDAMTRPHPNTEGEQRFTCLKCGERCQGYRIPNLKIFELQRKLITEKRKDEDHLVKAVDSLGFGGEKAPIVKNYQSFNQLVTSGPEAPKKITSKELKQLPDGDRELIVDMDNMDARDRETIRKDLEKVKRKIQGDGWPQE